MPSGRSGETVRAFGRFWELNHVPASGWINAAVSPDMSAIFPGMIKDSDAEEMFRIWLENPEAKDRCILTSRRALERAGLREWHWTINMIKEIQGSWTHLNGLLTRQGVSASRSTLPDYLDAAYTLFEEKLGENEFKAFETRLRKIPGGLSIRPKFSTRQDLLAFAKD